MESTPRAKKRRVKEDWAGKGLEQILLATFYKLKDMGRNKDAKQVLKMLQTDKEASGGSPAEALALLLDCQ